MQTKCSSPTELLSRLLIFLMCELTINKFFHIIYSECGFPSPISSQIVPTSLSVQLHAFFPLSLENKLALLLVFCFKYICSSDEIATYNEIKILISICLKQGHPVSPRSPGKPKQKDIITHSNLIYLLAVNSVLVFKDASISQFTNTN